MNGRELCIRVLDALFGRPRMIGHGKRMLPKPVSRRSQSAVQELSQDLHSHHLAAAAAVGLDHQVRLPHLPSLSLEESSSSSSLGSKVKIHQGFSLWFTCSLSIKTTTTNNASVIIITNNGYLRLRINCSGISARPTQIIAAGDPRLATR